MSLLARTDHGPSRALKFHQAAIVYLHYAVLYEVGAWVLLERGLFPATRGPEWVWFAAGVAIAALVIAGLWWWQNVWFARVVWALVTLRLPTLIEGAFFGSELDVPQGLYAAAGLVVLVNLWALARAAWDV
ncbi:MAG: hypothetical protein ACODAA_02690 [Gemmatimonadota bacterium]